MWAVRWCGSGWRRRIDISDGLSVDLQHLCEESGVRAEVEAALLPIGAARLWNDALHGGDDYELLFTADSGARVPQSIAGVPVHRIGRMLRRKAGAAADDADGGWPAKGAQG